ncbi:hypothetical protein C8J56DRAFT_1061527 [Mycena floridula]|nr:hypothetical protein C8J56DRAFT_1061527 [Mycena floridula]
MSWNLRIRKQKPQPSSPSTSRQSESDHEAQFSNNQQDEPAEDQSSISRNAASTKAIKKLPRGARKILAEALDWTKNKFQKQQQENDTEEQGATTHTSDQVSDFRLFIQEYVIQTTYQEEREEDADEEQGLSIEDEELRQQILDRFDDKLRLQGYRAASEETRKVISAHLLNTSLKIRTTFAMQGRKLGEITIDEYKGRLPSPPLEPSNPGQIYIRLGLVERSRLVDGLTYISQTVPKWKAFIAEKLEILGDIPDGTIVDSHVLCLYKGYTKDQVFGRLRADRLFAARSLPPKPDSQRFVGFLDYLTTSDYVANAPAVEDAAETDLMEEDLPEAHEEDEEEDGKITELEEAVSDLIPWQGVPIVDTATLTMTQCEYTEMFETLLEHETALANRHIGGWRTHALLPDGVEGSWTGPRVQLLEANLKNVMIVLPYESCSKKAGTRLNQLAAIIEDGLTSSQMDCRNIFGTGDRQIEIFYIWDAKENKVMTIAAAERLLLRMKTKKSVLFMSRRSREFFQYAFALNLGAFHGGLTKVEYGREYQVSVGTGLNTSIIFSPDAVGCVVMQFPFEFQKLLCRVVGACLGSSFIAACGIPSDDPTSAAASAAAKAMCHDLWEKKLESFSRTGPDAKRAATFKRIAAAFLDIPVEDVEVDEIIQYRLESQNKAWDEDTLDRVAQVLHQKPFEQLSELQKTSLLRPVPLYPPIVLQIAEARQLELHQVTLCHVKNYVYTQRIIDRIQKSAGALAARSMTHAELLQKAYRNGTGDAQMFIRGNLHAHQARGTAKAVEFTFAKPRKGHPCVIKSKQVVCDYSGAIVGSFVLKIRDSSHTLPTLPKEVSPFETLRGSPYYDPIRHILAFHNVDTGRDYWPFYIHWYDIWKHPENYDILYPMIRAIAPEVFPEHRLPIVESLDAAVNGAAGKFSVMLPRDPGRNQPCRKPSWAPSPGLSFRMLLDGVLETVTLMLGSRAIDQSSNKNMFCPRSGPCPDVGVTWFCSFGIARTTEHDYFISLGICHEGRWETLETCSERRGVMHSVARRSEMFEVKLDWKTGDEPDWLQMRCDKPDILRQFIKANAEAAPVFYDP